MDDSKRTKILGGTLAAVLGFGLMRPDQMLLEPIQKAKQELVNAQENLDTKSLQDMQRQVAEQQLEDARLISVMPEPTVAMAEYQSWITNLAEQCNFVQPDVTPGAAKQQEGRYTSVSVNVETEARMEDLSRFLYLFEQADLLHRISGLEIKSTGSTGTPRMEIVLQAEALSIAGAESRDQIFPAVKLPEAVTTDATTLELPVADDFPQGKSFFARIGREMVQVEEISEDGQLTLKRGQQGTKAMPHSDEESLELFPVAPNKTESSFDQYTDFLADSPFLKPVPPRVYKPRLTVKSQTAQPGDTVKITARADDVNQDIGATQINLIDAMEGMTVNPETGEFEWVVPEDFEPQKYVAKFVLTQKNNSELRVEKEAEIEVRLPNEAPQLKVDASAIVILGREFKLDFTAEDDGGADKLTYSIEGDTPDGLTVEGTSFVWAPPRTFVPGEYEVTLKASDSGSPAQSASATVRFDVQDDVAAATRLIGATTQDGIGKAWIWNQARNERFALKEGEKIVIADINATIKKISNRAVEFQDEEGLWKLDLGEYLRNRELIQAAVKETPAEEAAPATEEQPEEDPQAEETITQSKSTEATPATEETESVTADAE